MYSVYIHTVQSKYCLLLISANVPFITEWTDGWAIINCSLSLFFHLFIFIFLLLFPAAVDYVVLSVNDAATWPCLGEASLVKEVLVSLWLPRDKKKQKHQNKQMISIAPAYI